MTMQTGRIGRTGLRIVHILAGIAAFAMVARFLATTLWVELAGTPFAIAAAKGWIVTRLPFLIVCFMLVGGTGFFLSNRKPAGLAATKMNRMKIIAATGIFILVPAALFLNWKVRDAAPDAAFYLVQGIEIAAGAVNLTLLFLNMRDGLKMRGRLRY